MHDDAAAGIERVESPERVELSIEPGTPPRDQLPESLRVEEGLDQATLDSLREKGHDVSVVERWSFGSAKVIVRDQENGCWLGGADPRRVAYALGY